MSNALVITDLKARFGELEILNGINLSVPYGEVHALMGPNGSGKSTLTHVLMGSSDYDASGSALVGGVEVMGLPVHERARAGLFEAFQYPTEVPGVSLDDLVTEMTEVDADPAAAQTRAGDATRLLGMDRFMDRAINAGLSGGEKKRSEMFQLAVASPKVAILDEIDSGLDIDAVREVAALVETLRSPSLGVLVITHYSRILRYMNPDKVHVMVDGRVVESGGPEIAERLESEGYAAVR
ncbi:MAG: Fe-S cluster assembly ATPase SufC [Actinomycetota bacterium]|nr:Fe-S cluster assembly ATPase SufC [Actinomycetota bacterium]